MASRPITNDRLYEAINSSRLELKGDITELRQQYNRLETKMNSFEVAQAKNDGKRDEEQAVLSNKVLAMFGIANIVLIGISEAVFRSLFK